MILSDELLELAGRAGAALKAREEMVAVVESAAGGLVSAALLAIAGASEFYAGGVVMYTASTRRLLVAQLPIPDGTRGATERFAVWEADVAVAALAAQWGVGETGAAGPAGNRYGDPSGHAWVAVRGPGRLLSAQVLTGSDDRLANMETFAVRCLQLLNEALGAA